METSTGDDGTARIRAFVNLQKEDLESVAAEKEVIFSVPSKGHEVRAKLVRTVGSLELSSQPLPAPSADQVGKVLRATIANLGGAHAALIQTLSPDRRKEFENFLGRLDLACASDDTSTWPSW